MKDDNEVISEFNEYVNLSASELEKWLKSDDSSKAGWHKDGGDGESVGQDSGHKIVEILKANPGKDPEKYTEEQIQHMRKVASYCKRHLAQESKGLKEKDPEEVKKTKSYISLMNWGHDPLKAMGKGGSSSGKNGGKSSSKKQEDEGEEQVEEQEQNGEEAEEDDKKAGDKRKQPAQQSGASKKRETSKGESSKKENGGDEEKEEEDGEGEPEAEDDGDYEEDGNDASGDKSSGDGPSKGDTVSWKWGSGHPEGKVLDVKEDEATITTKRGNEVSRKGKPDDPAVILDAGKSKAIKLAHELD